MTDVPGSDQRATRAESGPLPRPRGTAAGRRGTAADQRAAALSLAEEQRRSATAVLADRIAATLRNHQPGWRLPRYSAMARRYQASTAEISAAMAELIARHLVRRQTDGQLYRASPAENLIRLEGIAELVSLVDPMGTELACQSRQVSWRRVPGDIARALQIPPSEPVCMVRLLWTVDDQPAALILTYLPADMAGSYKAADPAPGGQQPEQETGAAGGLNLMPLTAQSQPGEESADPVQVGRPAALRVEMQLPPQSVAKSLRLSAGQPADMVTVRFDDPEAERPVALTVAALRPDLFRIAVESAESPLPPGGEDVSPTASAVDDPQP